jgi:hypothetical protein
MQWQITISTTFLLVRGFVLFETSIIAFIFWICFWIYFIFLDEEYNNMAFFELQTFCEPNVPLEPISCLSWDPLEEALWTGTSAVSIAYNTTIFCYISCKFMKFCFLCMTSNFLLFIDYCRAVLCPICLRHRWINIRLGLLMMTVKWNSWC